MHRPPDIWELLVDEIDVVKRLRDIDPVQVAALQESFAEVGMRTPITVRKNPDAAGRKYLLTAGGHRLAAARALEWDVISAFVTDDDELNAELWEVDENLARAELSPADRAMFTFRRKELYLLKYPETAHGGDRKSSRQVGDLIDRAERKSFVTATAELTGKAERVIQRDAERGEKICEAALRILRGTRLDNGATLDRLKRLPSDVAQIAFVEGALAEERRVSAESKQIRANQQKIKHAVRLTKMEIVAERGRKTAPTSDALVYPVYYADPPWRFGAWSEETGHNKSAENHYPTMPTPEIIELMQKLIGGNHPAVFFCWATNPMLHDALQVMEACGFTYVHHWIWDKVVAGTGYWGRDCHELLLIGRRGEVAAPLPGTQPNTVYTERKTDHSVKPDFFAEQIERLFPDIAKIELFCRRPRKGWDAWGFEAKQPDEETVAETDPHYDAVCAVFARKKMASPNIISKFSGVPYTDVCRVLERLEREGLVSVATSSGRRQWIGGRSV